MSEDEGEDKMGDETYSTIFSSLKHPIRRKILRMLSEKPLSFSEILTTLAIDSGHLSYHLESLGELISHTTDGKYALSSFGVAAVKLMSGVEENSPIKNRKSRFLFRGYTRWFVVLITVILVCSSFYFILYVAPPVDLGGGSVGYSRPLTVLPSQAFTCYIIRSYTSTNQNINRTNPSLVEYAIENQAVNTFTEWTVDSYRLDIDFYGNYSISKFYFFSLRVYDLTGNLVYNQSFGYQPGEGIGFGAPYQPLYVSVPGIYRAEIVNLGYENLTTRQFHPRTGIGVLSPANMSITVKISLDRTVYQRPFFIGGAVLLFIAALSYPVFLVVKWASNKRKWFL